MSAVMAPEKASAEVVGSDLAVLRERVRALESGGARPAVQPLGVPALDRRLPGGGLALGVLHQVEGKRAEWDDAPAAGFCLALIAPLLASRAGPAVWVTRRDDLSGRGIAALGLDPARFLIVRADDDRELLWAMEEALKCRSLAAVVGEAGELEPAAGRRLQLAAEARGGETRGGEGGVTAFLLRRRFGPPRRAEPPSTAHSRWCVAAAPSAPAPLPELPGRPRWQVELKRCRGAAPGSFIVEWDDASGDFAMAAALCDGPDQTAGAGLPRRRRSGLQEAELRQAS